MFQPEMINQYQGEDTPYCYFHPKEVGIGVCPLCLTERLVILASKKHHVRTGDMTKKSSISFLKIFAFESFFNRLEFRRSKTDNSDQDAFTSQEDSFISIKFEENGVASWKKKGNTKLSTEHNNMPWNCTLSKGTIETMSVIEHKPPSSLRWRKRIGHMFQVIRWRRSNKENVCHGGNDKVVEGVKVSHGWIKTWTKKK